MVHTERGGERDMTFRWSDRVVDLGVPSVALGRPHTSFGESRGEAGVRGGIAQDAVDCVEAREARP